MADVQVSPVEEVRLVDPDQDFWESIDGKPGEVVCTWHPTTHITGDDECLSCWLEEMWGVRPHRR